MGPAPPSVVWLIIGLLLLVAGLAGVVLAVVGQRLGREPTCRACRFDLTGIDTAAPQARCPECGAVLGTRRVRTGVRQMRRWMLGSSLILVLLGLVGVWHQTAWRLVAMPLRERPFFWLAWDVRHATPAHADAAITELWRRHDEDGMDFRHLVPLLDVVLDVHETAPNARWSARAWGEATRVPAWQNVLYTAVRNGSLGTEQMDRYLKNALIGVDRHWHAPDRHRRLTPVDLLRFQPPRPYSLRAADWAVVVTVPTRIELNDEPIELEHSGFGPEDRERYHASWHAIAGDGMNWIGPGGMFTSTRHPIRSAVLRDLPVGTHTVRIRWQARVFVEHSSFEPDRVDVDRLFGGDAPDAVLELPATTMIVDVFPSLEAAIELVDSTSPYAQPLPIEIRQPGDPEPKLRVSGSGSATLSLTKQRRAFVGSPPQIMKVGHPDYPAGPRWYRPATDEERAMLAAESWVVSDVRLRIGGVLYPRDDAQQSTVQISPGSFGLGEGYAVDIAGIPADATGADVVLVPNLRFAVEFTDADRVWNEPIELGRVRIVREGEDGEEGEEGE